ncbi:MAG TPA: TA system VapC family ribonuclease toxin [Chthoniobacterales bacterium]|jgi:toxin-antitoxin system PIN domain toxin|nr:TA system VapC family ribonuclease toxin [Chthoniobacterales bacterium]
MFVVDTNILLYAANSDCREHDVCLELVERARNQAGAWYATWSILYDFLRIVSHPRVLSRPWKTEAAWHFVTSLLSSPGFSVLVETDRHALVIDEIVGEAPDLAGNILSDLHVAALMREHGIATIYTRDVDFHRFSFLRVIDPMSGGTAFAR